MIQPAFETLSVADLGEATVLIAIALAVAALTLTIVALLKK